MHPIGKIYSPYKKSKDIPIQGRFKDNVEAWIELKDEYVKGLKELKNLAMPYFSIIYINHKKKLQLIILFSVYLLVYQINSRYYIC
jgi:tRNA (Thr-GGU) A37 N-methylase